jgi:hypothetical protein
MANKGSIGEVWRAYHGLDQNWSRSTTSLLTRANKGGIGEVWSSGGGLDTGLGVISDFYVKPSTHRMYDLKSTVPHIRSKVVIPDFYVKTEYSSYA